MTTTFIDPVTKLPHRLGEIYSDRNIMMVGSARWTPTVGDPLAAGTLDIDPAAGMKVITTPIDGGSAGAAVTSFPSGISISLAWDNATQRGSSVWVRMNRLSGTQAVTVGNGITVYGPNTLPTPSESDILLFYRATAVDVVATASFIIAEGPVYTKLGVGTGQRVFSAIVGDDPNSTHTDLQTAISASPTNSWILVKKMCQVTNTITTMNKVIKLHFVGSGTGLISNGATVGIQFDQPGCELTGFGELRNFATAVNLNNKTGCRVEMAFSGNGVNPINYGTLTYDQVNIQGSYGLTENSLIASTNTHGAVPRWNNTTKRWEGTATTISDQGLLMPILYSAIVGDTPSIDTHSDLQTAINSSPNGGRILVRKMNTVTTPITTNNKSLTLEFQGQLTGIRAVGAAAPYTVGAALTPSSAGTYAVRNLANQSYAPLAVSCTYSTTPFAAASYVWSGTTVTVTIPSTLGMLAGQTLTVSAATGATLNGNRIITGVLNGTQFIFTEHSSTTGTGTLSVSGLVSINVGSTSPAAMGISQGSTSITLSGSTSATLNATYNTVAIVGSNISFWAPVAGSLSGTTTVTVPTTCKVTTTANPSTIGYTTSGQSMLIGSATAAALNGTRTTCDVQPTSISFTVPSGTVFAAGTLSVVEPFVTVTPTTTPPNLGDGLSNGQSVYVSTAANGAWNNTLVSCSNVTGTTYQFSILTIPSPLTGAFTTNTFVLSGTYTSVNNIVTLSPSLPPIALATPLEVGQKLNVIGSASAAIDGNWTISSLTASTISFLMPAAPVVTSGSFYMSAYYRNVTATASNTFSAGNSVTIRSATDSRLNGTRKVFAANGTTFTIRYGEMSTVFTNGTLAYGSSFTGLILQGDGCRVVGLGTLSGFSTAIDNSSRSGTRVEMVFSNNDVNIANAASSDLVNVEGSLGVNENSQIETSLTDGSVPRWNNATKRWEGTAVTISGQGLFNPSGVQSPALYTNTDMTLTNYHYAAMVDASTGVRTITLPAATAANCGIMYQIKKIDSTANNVTVAGIIDGATNWSTNIQYDSRTIMCVKLSATPTYGWVFV